MKTSSSPNWDYVALVKEYIKPTDKVLDIGTGGGERFLQLARYYKIGVGTDSDPEMVEIAVGNAKKVNNTSFLTDTDRLNRLSKDFNVIINRHAPFNLVAIKEHLVNHGYFITQQVGQNNTANIKKVLGQSNSNPPITKIMIQDASLKTLSFREYDIDYYVEDIESLVFWLKALDVLHADIEGSKAVGDVDTLNKILKGNVTDKGFKTNEHRYLVIAQK